MSIDVCIQAGVLQIWSGSDGQSPRQPEIEKKGVFSGTMNVHVTACSVTPIRRAARISRSTGPLR
jgi:hypothetical protein